ncbi:hypothetical protein HJG60_011415 [Phyllostomus discolor]|uniref:Uncharacterized protein n=1 Tax=Phyllostomus discolor TaxID=89673 RepID=A0A834E1U6_9CHIR|nr:hypothetical protein HJG60_011415 [Phyllostomus discolor]
MAKLDKEHSNLLSHAEGQWLCPSRGSVEKHHFAWERGGLSQWHGPSHVARTRRRRRRLCRRGQSPPRGSSHGTRVRPHSASIFRSLPQTSVVGQQTHHRVPGRVLPESLRVASPSDAARELLAVCTAGLLSFRTKGTAPRSSHWGDFPSLHRPLPGRPAAGGPSLLCGAFRRLARGHQKQSQLIRNDLPCWFTLLAAAGPTAPAASARSSSFRHSRSRCMLSPQTVCQPLLQVPCVIKAGG